MADIIVLYYSWACMIYDCYYCDVVLPSCKWIYFYKLLIFANSTQINCSLYMYVFNTECWIFLSISNVILFQNTVIVERCWKVPLSKEGKPPRLHPRRHRVYRLVEDTKHKSQDKMELILTQTVPSECSCLMKNC